MMSRVAVPEPGGPGMAAALRVVIVITEEGKLYKLNLYCTKQ